MADMATGIPSELHLTLDPTPSIETLRALGGAIDAFNARTVPLEAQRFALLLHDQDGGMAGGLFGVLAWQWLFVQALWIDDAWRRRGIGRALLARAEAHAMAEGCHSVGWIRSRHSNSIWRSVIRSFGALENYPESQTRWFLRKRLGGDASMSG